MSSYSLNGLFTPLRPYFLFFAKKCNFLPRTRQMNTFKTPDHSLLTRQTHRRNPETSAMQQNTLNTALFFLLVLLGVNTTTVTAQEHAPLPDSREMLARAEKLYNEEKYDSCIALCSRISVNDSNYYEALHKQISGYLAAKKDSLAVISAREALLHKTRFTYAFYNQLGVAYIALDRNEEAATTFRTAIARYPYENLLYYNLAIAQYKLKRPDEAVASLEKAIVLEPYYAKSHLKLGMICLEQNKIVPAILSLEMFLILEPESPNAKETILLLEKLVKGELEATTPPAATVTNTSGTDDFSEVEEILKSKIALNKKYKSQTKLNYDLVKQIQVLFEKLKYDKNDKGFFMQNYVPFYSDLFAKEHFEAYVYYSMTSVADEDMTKWLKKNKSKVESFTSWAAGFLNNKRATGQVVINGEKTTAPLWYFPSNSLEAIGAENEKKKPIGYWQIFYANGELEAEGLYTDGEKSGSWKWYYDNGVLKEVSHFRNGLRNGTTELYTESGLPSSRSNYTDDKLEGDYTTFFISGDPEIVLHFKDGKKAGPASYFYQNGSKRYELNYLNDEIDGAFQEFYTSGERSMACTYSQGKKNGPYTSYFRNGKKESDGADKDNQPAGPWKYYYESGQLEKEGEYSPEGEPKGDWKFYHENGQLSDEKPFSDKGKLSGKLVSYDKHGKLSYVHEYKNGAFLSYQDYDVAGKVIAEGKGNNKKFPVTYKFPNGNTETEGLLEDGKKTGLWKYYIPCGKLARSENLVKDELNGITSEYYTNDTLDNRVNYADGEKNGYFRSYYKNGKPFCEGWYVHDKQCGEWTFYNEKGTRISVEYYDKGIVSGWQQHYFPNGKLAYSTYLEEDLLLKGSTYDSSGTGIATLTTELPAGSGTYTPLFYSDGSPRSTKVFRNGCATGKYTLYYANGKPELIGNYQIDKMQGLWTAYWENGHERYEENYVDGKLSGTAKRYYADGTLAYEGTYVSGKPIGKCVYYHENKQPELELSYENGKLEGPTTVYSADAGQVVYVRKFENDILVAYTYKDKEGNLLPDIPVKNESARIVAYFPNGNKSVEKEIRNGFAYGPFTEYFSNGKVSETGTLAEGNKEGVYKTYYPSGQLKSEENYYYDKKDGACSYFFENGKPERIEHYYLDDKHGKCMTYDQSGKVIKSENYYYGIAGSTK